MNAIREIKRAEILGYCMGVKKAVEAVLTAVRTAPEKEVFTFGPLIHNADTIAYLEKLGVKTIEPKQFTPDTRYKNTKIVIRAHGIPPEQFSLIKKSGAEAVNATCPRVVSNQLRAEKYAKDHIVLLAGDKNHGELIGIAGHVNSIIGSKCIILQNAEEAESACIEHNGLPAVLIAQTTIKQSEYDAIASILRKRLPSLTVLNTICPATAERQAALKKLAYETEAILVIGGKNSANTKRLLHTASAAGKPAWLIENAAGIPEEIYTYTSVGISAGASTPDFIINEVEEVLRTHV